MAFEQMPQIPPQIDKPKTKLQLIKEQIAETEAAFNKMDPSFPEYDMLKEQLISYNEELKRLTEKPELHTQGSYKIDETQDPLESDIEDMTADAEEIKDGRDRRAS